ncbi:MAG: hypothetical protein ACK4ZJ_08130 [Allorhizobium sp.]
MTWIKFADRPGVYVYAVLVKPMSGDGRRISEMADGKASKRLADRIAADRGWRRRLLWLEDL